MINPEHYFSLSTDADILNAITSGVAKKGLNVYTNDEQVIVAAAMIEGRKRGLMAAFRADVGFSWSDVFTYNLKRYQGAEKINPQKYFQV